MAQGHLHCRHLLFIASGGRILSAVILMFALLLMALPAPMAIAVEEPHTDTGENTPVKMLFNFEGTLDTAVIPQRDVTARVVPWGDSQALRLDFARAQAWPGIDLVPADGPWDLSSQAWIELEVTNVGKTKGRLYCRADNPGADGKSNCNTGSIDLKTGEKGKLRVEFHRKTSAPESLRIFGVRAGPFGTETKGATLDTSSVTQLVIFVGRPKTDHSFVIDNIRAGGSYEAPFPPVDPDAFYPLIDEFGQYIHKDWPGKTRSLADLKARGKAEEQEMAAHPAPRDRNRYGGWLAGPELKATGRFRVQKHDGKWWFVDPDGRLFWSQGIDCVNFWSSTPIDDREHYYKLLPEKGTPLGAFYGKGSWAPHGYYKGKTPYRHFDFSRANLLRRYGDNWQEIAIDRAHRRLRSWGLNTIANWSDWTIRAARRTPYVGTIHCSSKPIAGSEGYWGQFSDVFDPAFRKAIRKRVANEKGKAIGDPWCIGFFVDNELGWGKEDSLALAALASPAEQAAKKVFIADLKAKYKTISALNAAWGTAHSSWDALLASQEKPDAAKARDDLLAFYTKTAETSFRTIREELKAVDPDMLYFGCRFAWVNDWAARAAAKYCDVIGYNRYKYSVADHALPDGIDKPVIIGEFHFGALDRGMFHTGLRKAKNQEHRAQLYEDYVRGALRNPLIVGAHWFQYRDQATTGRGDGENYQIGFVDICDNPYPEIVSAARRIGADLFQYRLEK